MVIDRVLVLDDAHEELCGPLAAQFPDVVFDGARTRAQAVAACGDATGIVALAHDITEELVANAPRLRWIQALTTGTDHLRTVRNIPDDIVVTSARGAMAPAVAEFIIMQMLVLSRRLPEMMRNQRREHWELRVRGRALAGRTVLLVGLGAIAEAFAERIRPFGLHVIGVSDGRTEVAGFDEIVPRAMLARVVANADFLVLTVPQNERTRRLVDAGILAAMKPTAFIINVARGGVVDQDALIEALTLRSIAGAALDVFDPEPLPVGSPLWALENSVVTSHVAGDTWDLYRDVVPIIASNLYALQQDRPQDLINRVSFALV